MQFWINYSLFLAKTLTLVIAIVATVGGLIAISRKNKTKTKEGKLEIKKINTHYQEYIDIIQAEVLTKAEHKKINKAKKAEEKARAKATELQPKKKIFVLNFAGDIKASAVSAMREEITGILLTATANDEVVLVLESGGGMVTHYGLAASQLRRLKEKNISLTICVDRIAASGGYLMACVADQLLAAPFSIIGSIGVIAQLPNLHRFLKNKDIDFEQITAGAYKRTLTVFGENTEEGRKKMTQEVEEIHHLFKDFIQQHRPQVDIPLISTGEHWLGTRAIELKLVDRLTTSDDYLLVASKENDIYQVTFVGKKSLVEKIFSSFTSITTLFKQGLVM